MKKTLLVVVIILAVILALPVINLIQWTFKTKKPMDIILVDKTVPTLERENHRSISWVLTNDRFVDKDKKSNYSYKKDYYGFFPQRPVRDRIWEKKDYRLTDVITMATKYDAIYVADTYGVFINEWLRGYIKSRRSRKLYGGFNNTDYLLVKEMKDRNKLIILEYNSFDYPTAAFESFRIQEKLGIKSTGWTGKYFASLDTTSENFPIWMTSLYRKEYGEPWKFTKPGVVLVTQKNDIIVLEEGKQLKNAQPLILTDTANCQKYGVANSVVFNNWFEVIDPLECNVISKFELQTTTLGDTLLSESGLSNRFPAVVQETSAPSVFYLAGNFAYSDIPVWTARFNGIDKLKGVFYSSKPDDSRRFFWLYYKPLIKGIFENYYNSVNNIAAIDK